MSKLRHALRLGIESESDGEQDERIEVGNTLNSPMRFSMKVDDHEQLLESHESNVKNLFNKTDATLAQVTTITFFRSNVR